MKTTAAAVTVAGVVLPLLPPPPLLQRRRRAPLGPLVRPRSCHTAAAPPAPSGCPSAPRLAPCGGGTGGPSTPVGTGQWECARVEAQAVSRRSRGGSTCMLTTRTPTRTRTPTHLLALCRDADDVARVAAGGLDAHVVKHLLLQERGLRELLGLLRHQQCVQACELGQHEEHKPVGQRTVGPGLQGRTAPVASGMSTSSTVQSTGCALRGAHQRVARRAGSEHCHLAESLSIMHNHPLRGSQLNSALHSMRSSLPRPLPALGSCAKPSGQPTAWLQA